MFRTKKIPLRERGKEQAYMREVFCRACLRFVGNDSESYGLPWQFEPWQLENVWNPIFGTGKMVSGYFKRHYRRALIGVPRGVGKTVLACAMLLSEASMNPIQNGQYGLVADSEDNARNAFETLASMIRLSPELSATWKIFKKEIRNVETNAWIRTFPNKVSALQGWHFNFAICDEVHVYRDDAVWQAVISGQGRIPNAMAIAITTASDRRSGFLWDWYQRLINGEDDKCYCYWVGLDDQDDPSDRRTWKKVMISPRVTREQLEEQLGGLGARRFERYQLNRFPMDKVEEPFMKRKDIEACEGNDSPGIDKSRWFTVGVDGAVSGDVLAVVAAQQGDDGYWSFEETTWDVTGQMGVYDLTDVADVLDGYARESGRPLICCDPNRLTFLVNWLQQHRGVELFEMRQTPRVMAPASEMLASAVSRHTARLGNTPKLAQHCLNAVADESKAYGRRLSSTGHGKGSERIDCAIAAAMAMSAYDSNVTEQTGSVEVLAFDI